jgi:hypothetical protein
VDHAGLHGCDSDMGRSEHLEIILMGMTHKEEKENFCDLPECYVCGCGDTHSYACPCWCHDDCDCPICRKAMEQDYYDDVDDFEEEAIL